MSRIEEVKKLLDKGLTEIGCPDYNVGEKCVYFGRQNEYGACGNYANWFNCPLWTKGEEIK